MHAEQNEETLEQFLTTLFSKRADTLIKPAPEVLKDYYNRQWPSSDRAYKQEFLRSIYLNTWADSRDISLLDSESRVHILDKSINGDLAKVRVKHDEKIDYLHKQQFIPPFDIDSFKIGTIHHMVLRKNKDSWTVVRDDFSDPIAAPPDRIPKSASVQYFPEPQDDSNQSVAKQQVQKRYNREKAVHYANKYAGFPFNEDKLGVYNRKYRDFNDYGGDCTNFVSQVLGDKEEGGGLPMTDDWYYRNGKHSKSWAHTDSFLNFLKTSGYAEFIKVGLFHEVTNPGSDFPNGAINKLQPGDLIGYEKNNDIVHFSVVVGKNSQGYPVVNSHTANRFHVPWDLGWDKNTKFWLIHIKDG